MKTFIVRFESKTTNLCEEMVVQSNTLSHAQDKFLTWLKFEPQWFNLTDLYFEFREVKLCILEHRVLKDDN